LYSVPWSRSFTPIETTAPALRAACEMASALGPGKVTACSSSKRCSAPITAGALMNEK
jgi:hypothetical protein